MRLTYTFKTAVNGVLANKTRSLLTMLGIIIGITSIILIVAIGKGAENLILNEIQGMGADMVVIRPGQEPTGPTDVAETIFADSLKIRDIEALKKRENVPELVSIAPALIVPGSVSYGGETFRPDIFGWSAEFMGEITNIYPEYGVYFDEADIRARASVAVIGKKVKEELFGEDEALGKNIKIKNRNFRIIGILPQKGQSAFFNVDEVVVIPYSTAQEYLAGIDYFHEVMIKVASPEVVDRSVRDIEATLREMHDITDPSKDDFFVVTQQGLVSQVGIILDVLTLFLSSVVAISLVVGGIGVMNIMLVSVTERTKEIGLRKALGATEKNVMTQFLIEAAVLTIIGGIVGIALGVLLALLTAYLITHFSDLEWVFAFPMSAAILGLSVSAFVGLVFGLYPAWKASKKSPMEALRYE